MEQSNLERMIQLAEEVFAVRSDPDQLNVNEEVMERLHQIHPATLSEEDDGHGPVAWVLVIPTTLELMEQFLGNQISEKELFDRTPPGETYDAVYLCSALVLPEHRRKGIAKRLSVDAIRQMQLQHPLKAVFVWAFSREGEFSAEEVARMVNLPLYKRFHG